MKGRGIFASTACLAGVKTPAMAGGERKYTTCICTMLRNRGRFLKEWIVYHGGIGVECCFVYDNNSNDGLVSVIEELRGDGCKINRHVLPRIKSQEAGFAHCALQAGESCESAGFIDVDEFLHPPSNFTLPDVLRNYSDSSPCVGELRTSCLTFGPSGFSKAPQEGVMAGFSNPSGLYCICGSSHLMINCL